MPTMEMAEQVMAKVNSRNDWERFSRSPSSIRLSMLTAAFR